MGPALFPSYYDVFPLVPLEAMACGLPVIVSAQAGISEIITDGKDGFVLKDPEDVGTFAGLLRALVNPELRDRLGEAARKTALRHTWDTVAERTMAEYEKIFQVKAYKKGEGE